MNTLDVYYDGNHIRGIRVTYFDGLIDSHSKQVFNSIPLHGSND
jgi:hypothetical protein